MDIKEALEYGIEKLKESNIQEPSLKARLVLAYLLNKNKEYLMVHYEEKLKASIKEKYMEAITKLCENEPLQYITNKQEFMGLEFYVDENVLIPQPDTEVLVEEVINIANGILQKKTVGVDGLGDSQKNIQILDLCTGSGAIGISIAKNIKNCNVTLSDISKGALNIAKRNAVGAGLCSARNTDNTIKIIQSDLFENINNKFDIIVSNPPYIKTEIIKTLDKEVQKEPKLALDGGKDGLEIYRRIINEAYRYLNNDGYLCLEIGYDQKEEVINLLKNAKAYTQIYSKKDLSRKDRIIVSKKEN